MRDIFRIRVKTKTGEIELEGSQIFVEKKMNQLPSLVKKLDDALEGTNISTKEISEPKEKTNKLKKDSNKNKAKSSSTVTSPKLSVPHNFGKWLTMFPDKIRQADILLIACFYIQNRSADNIFKCFLAKNTLARSGIELTNLESSITRLLNEQLILVSKKAGKLTLYKVSNKGQNHLKELLKE